MSVAAVSIPGVSLGRELGRGSSGVVYHAERQGQCYAVKVSRSVTPADVIRSFRREATVLACLRHPNIARVFDAGEVDGRAYLVLELVEGESLAARLTAGPLTIAETARLGQGIAGALAAAHRLGLVHQDVNPANIMIDAAGRTILVDFGLLGRAGGVTRDEVVGTVLYSAPEQIGMLNRPVDARSDLYALGAVLHSCLTGRPPFEADDVAELMRLHAVAAPPDPRAARDDVPPGLVDVVATLLAKDPDDRFQSADDLVAALVAATGPAAGAAGTPAGAGKRRTRARAGPVPTSTFASDQLVGRAVPLAELRAVWERTRRPPGERTVVRIAGEMGVGKTHLVQAFLRAARSAPGVVVMEAKCAELADTPFVIFRSLLDSWLHPPAGGAPEGRRALLRAAAGADAAVLADLHPSLAGREPESADTQRRGPDAGALRVVPTAENTGVRLRLAVTRFIRALARQGGGLVLWVDDAQWLGAADRQLLEELAADTEPVPLLVIGTSRRSASLLPAGRSRCLDILLEPLDECGVAELIRTRLGDVADDWFVREVAARTSGNPLAVFEYMRAVMDAGLIRPSWDGFHLDDDGLVRLALPDEVLGLIRRRVGQLCSSALPVLRTAAAIGHQFDLELLAAAAGVAPEDARRALTEAESRQLVTPARGVHPPEPRTGPPELGRWSFVHDCVREALLSTLDADGLRRQHAAIADAMEVAGAAAGLDLFALARHAVSGGLPAARQYRLARAAAEAALAERAPTEARSMFRTAADAAARAQIAVDAAFETGFGLACSWSIRPEDARTHFARALHLETDPLARAALHAEAAGIEYGMRNFSAAVSQVRDGLAAIGRPVPGPVLVGPVVLGRLACALAMRWPATGFGSASGEARRRYEIELLLHEIGAPNELFHFDIPSFLWHMSGLYPMQRLGLGELFIRGHLMLNVVAAELGRRRTVHRSLRTFQELAERTGDPALLADLGLYAGIALLYLGETTAASEQLQATLRRAARWVDATLYDNAVSVVALDYSHRGFWREGVACLAPGAYGVDHVFSDLAITRARMATGLGEPAENLATVLAALPPAREEPARAFFALHGLLQIEAEDGRFGERFDHLLESAEALGRSPLSTAKYYRQYWLTRARGRLEQARAATGSERHERLRVARRCLREAWPAAALPLFRADLFVLRAIADQLADRPERALRRLISAQRLAVRLDAPRISFDVFVERARCLRSLGREQQAREEARHALTLAEIHGWIPRGRAVRREFGLADSPGNQVRQASPATSGRDRRRLDALLRVSAATNGALDPDTVADIVLAEITDILGADRALLLLPEEPAAAGPGAADPAGARGARLVPQAGRTARDSGATDLTSYARSIVARVHEEQRPVVVTGTAEGAALGSTSAVQHGLRSILAAPVPIEGCVSGVIYVDSQVAKGLFTEDDVDVLVTLAKQVGVALRTAEAARLQTRLAAERRERELAEVLRNVAEQAGSTLRTRDILARVLAAARPVLPHDSVWVLDQGPQSTIRVTEVYGDVDPRAVGSVLEDACPALNRAFTGATVDGRATDEAIRLPGVPRPLTCWLALPVTPLRSVPAVIVLAVDHTRTGPPPEVARMVLNTAATAFDNARLYEEARHSAATDPLTGLSNRRDFVEQATETATANARAPAGRATSAAMIDVDRFKQVNDRYGHAVGDEVLVEVARRIERSLRRGDVAGRLGGEEFAVLVTGDAEAAHRLGERVRLATCGEPVETSAGPLKITVSVGTATVDPGEPGPPLLRLLEQADRSLYAAKRGGRNQTVTSRR